MAIALAILLALVTAACLTLGLRGRTTGTTPHCRPCNFDLSGTPTNTPDATCPECGNPLTNPNAIRLGTRQRDPKLIALAAVLSLPALVSIYFATAGQGPIPAASKPTALLLLLEARHLSDPRAESAAAELATRRLAGELTDEQLTSLIDPALERMEDRSYAWTSQIGWPPTPSPWKKLLDDAMLSGLLDSDQLKQAYTAAALAWDAPQRIRLLEGDTLRFPNLQTSDELRLESGFTIIPSVTQAIIDGQLVTPKPHQLTSGGYLANVQTYRPMNINFSTVVVDRPIPLPPEGLTLNLEGERSRTIHARLTWRLEYHHPETFPDTRSRFYKTKLNEPLTARTVGFDYTIEVYATPADGLTLTTDTPRPEILAQLSMPRTAQLQVVPWRVTPEPCTSRAPIDRVRVLHQLMRRGSSTPDDAPWVVARVHLRRPDGLLVSFTEWPIGGFVKPVFSPGNLNPMSAPWGYIDLPDRPASIDIVLVPDPAHALRHTQADTLWNEPIVLENIPLDWSAVEAAEAEEANNLALTP